jgi:AcrR family transcriptional regulator
MNKRLAVTDQKQTPHGPSQAVNEKQRAIIEAASARFRYYGVGKTTMQEIATDAGVAVGTLYLYFSNKDALMCACTEEFIERHRQIIEKILASDRPAEKKLLAYLLDRFQQAEQTRTGSRHAAEITRAVLRLKPDRIREEGEMMWDTVVQILKGGMEAGQFEIATPEVDAKMLLYAIHAFFPHALTEPVVAPSEAEYREVIGWFLKRWRATVRAKSARTIGRAKLARRK